MSARQSIKEEKEYLKLFDKLSDAQLQSIVDVGAAYARAAKVYADSQKEEGATEDYLKQIEDYNKKLPYETETFRKKLESKVKKERKAFEAKQQRVKAETKQFEETQKQLMDAELENLAEKQRKKLEVESAFIKEHDQELQKEIEGIKKQYKLQEKQLQREHDRRKATISHTLTEEKRLEIEQADFKHEQKIRRLRAMRDDELKRALALAEQAQAGEKQLLGVKMDGITNFFSGEAGRTRMRNILGVVVGSLGVLYGFKVAAPLATQGLKNYFFKPQLISVYHRNSAITSILRGAKPASPDVILPRDLQERVKQISEGTRNTSTRKGLFGHMMLYGQPGTGKTLFAEQLARESKMDFAMMSGPSFDQFEAREAIVEIKKLFNWVNKSQNGLLLFVDECDSFLEDRTTLSPDRVRVLNEFINQTGTESRKFMLVFETNRPAVLDPAVHSRITRSVNFVAPEEEEVKKLLRLYIGRYIINEKPAMPWWKSLYLRATGGMPKKIDASDLTEELIDQLAKQMHEEAFVGRDISNSVIAMTQAAYSSPTFAVTEKLAQRVVDEQMDKKRSERTAFSSFTRPM